MKKVYVVALGVLMAVFRLAAQTPQLINYQAVARDATGNVLSNRQVGFRISILDSPGPRAVLYQETDTAATNAFGLATFGIGGGTVIIGNFSTIDWGNGQKYLQVEFDPTGGTDYVIMGSTQLISVPYALYAANGIAIGNQAGNTPYWNGQQWITTSSNIYNTGNNVGIGTANPQFKLSVAGNADFRRTGIDGLNYEFNMSDTMPTVNLYPVPHAALIVGEPSGIHSLLSLEDASYCCSQDSFTSVFGILDNSNPFRHIMRMTRTDFYMCAAENDLASGEYHISNAGISFLYEDTSVSTGWLLSNKAGTPGQVLMLNATADTATWTTLAATATEGLNSNISYFTPANDEVVEFNHGTNIIEAADTLANLTLILPANPVNGEILDASFVKPVSSIVISGGNLANVPVSALQGSNLRFIYYSAKRKWYNW